MDKHQARIRVYHTAPRFYVWSVPPSPDHVELVPTTDSEGECTQWEGSGTFSLSAPILDASVQELLQDEFYKSAREVLQFWIEVDLANLHRLKTGMRFFWMPAKYKPNGHAYGGRVMQGTNKADSIEAPMASMKELAAYLAVQLRWRGDLAGATRCALLLRHFFKDDTSGVTHDSFLHQAINTRVKGGEQNYLFRGVDALNTVIDEALGPDTVDSRGPKGK